MPYCKHCHLGIPPRDTSCPKCGREAEVVVRGTVDDAAEPKVLVGVNAERARSISANVLTDEAESEPTE